MKKHSFYLVNTIVLLSFLTIESVCAQLSPSLDINYESLVVIENNSYNCSENTTVSASGLNFCPDLEITNNSPYGDGTDEASGLYPLGVHTIVFSAIDDCNNEVTKEIVIEVIDGKAPVALCAYGLTVDLSSNCEVTLDAENLNVRSSDNCSAEADLDFKIAFVKPDGSYSYPVDYLMLNCNQLGENRVVLIVTDKMNNTAYCETIIKVEPGLCSPCQRDSTPSIIELSGNFGSGNGIGIDEVELFVNGSYFGVFNHSYSLGLFITSFVDSAKLTLEARKNDDINDGVNILDIIMIRRHMLQIAPFSSVYTQIAANMNFDDKIDILDIIEIRKVILNLIDEYAHPSTWHFVGEDQIFDPQNPFYTTIPFQVELADVKVGDRIVTNFIGVKKGDVNGDANANVRFADQLTISTFNQSVRLGEELSVVLTAELDRIQAYQLSINFDPTSLKFINIEGLDNDRTINLNNIDRGEILILQEDVFQSKELFKVNFQGLTNSNLNKVFDISSGRIQGMAVNLEDDLLEIELEFLDVVSENILYQNIPNPFKESTMINFNAKDEGDAEFRIFNTLGKIEMETKFYAKQGYNSLDIDVSDIVSSKLLFYQIEMEGYVETKRMMKR